MVNLEEIFNQEKSDQSCTAIETEKEILEKDAGLVTVIRVMYEGRYVEARLNNHIKM